MPSPRAETLFNLLHEARTKNQGHLSREEWLKIVQGFLDSALPKLRKGTTEVRSDTTDAEWIDYLESLPHLQGIDIKREIGKCQLWTQTNTGKSPTRRRIVNWLSKAERPVGYQGQGQSSFAPRPAPSLPEPKGWKEKFPDFIHKDKPWSRLDHTTQAHITSQMNKP